MSTWSHTRIQLFRQCPRKFWFQHIAKVELPEAPQTVEQFLGKRVHEALEWTYRRALDAVAPALEAVLARYATAWDREWSDAVAIVAKDMTAADYRRIGEQCLRDYHARHFPFDATRTMAIEQRIRFTLDERRGIHMTGFVDRVARDRDGTWQVHDYKTDQRLPTQADKDRDPQLAYYQIGVRELWPAAERIELTWHYLRFDQSITSRRDAAALDEVRGAAIATVADAESRGRDEQAFETHESRLCAWCGYQALCPVWKHRFKVAELPPNEFLGEPGVELVDRWARLDAERRGLAKQQLEREATIELIKQALFELAEREGLEVVAGSEQEAAIRRAERAAFPRKTAEPEAAAEFEAMLRASDRWPEVSGLDRHALERLWNDPGLDPALRMLLEPYVTVERERSARLRKRR